MANTEAKTRLAALFNPAAETPQRLAKRIAAAGLCSRRDAERRIAEGRVKVDGKIHESPAINVTLNQQILVDDKPLPVIESARLWRYYKPRGLIVSHRDETGRKTIFDAIKEQYPDTPRLVSVGRLDLDSEGLLLLTNNGELARHLELPSTGWTRKYRVRVHGRINPNHLAEMANGITINNVRYRPVTATLDRQAASNAWLTVTLNEGKNREIRHIMEHYGYSVSRLLRLSFGPFSLGRLKEGELAAVKPAVLREQLGLPPEKPARKNITGKSPTGKKPAEKRTNHAHHQRQKTRRKSRPASRRNETNR